MIKKNILALFVSLLCCLGVFSNTVHSETVTVNEQNQLHSGLSYQAKGNISSLADLSNGNFSVALNVTDGQEPTNIKAQLLDGPLLIGPDSTFQVKSGTINAQDSQNVQFTVNSGENIHPSLLISNVGKTQTGVALDMLVTVQDVTMTTTNDSFVRLSKGDGNVLVVQPTNLDGVQLSSQFFAHGTTNPVTFFMLPVVEDIDASQQFSMNATALGYGSNLTPDSTGLFTSTTQGVDGANDYPLGGLLYAFYGNTMLTQFNGTSNGQADPGTPGFWIFGDQGMVDKIDLTYPNSSVIFNYLDILSKHPIQTPTTLTGQQFSPFTFDAPLLNNYQLDKKANPNTPLTGSFTQTTQNFNFYYDKQSTVTVHFCDAQTGQEIQKAQVLTGYETEPYQFNVPTLNNYRYDDKLTEGSLSGNYGATNQDIKLFYHQKSSITFNLMDDTKVMSSQTLSGYSGDSYHYAAPILQNYRPANPEDYDGKFTNTVQTLNIPYQKILGNLTINYINITNNQQLLPSLSLTNHVGDNTIIRVPYVDNYHQVNTSPLTVKQELPTQSQDIYYAPNPYQLLVNFVDNEGNSIKPSLTLGTTYGQNFAFEAPPIKDYQLASGQVQNFNLRPLNPIENLTIHYVPTESSAHFIFEDENGKEVAQPETISGKTGTTYHFVPPYVKYLHLTQPSQEVISGKYDGTKKTIIVRYTHLKARVDVYGVDDRGNEVKHITETGLEGQSYGIVMPAFKNLQIKNSKYQSFTGVYDSQNKVVFVLYNHIRSYLTVNLRIDGQVKKSFTVKGYIGDHYSMKVPKLSEPYLTGGVSQLSGIYSQVHQTVNVDYQTISTSVNFNLYDSAGDYITSVGTTGKYGQPFALALPTSLTDSYGNPYRLEMNNVITGYHQASNESYNVVYAYSGSESPRTQAYHPQNQVILQEKPYTPDKQAQFNPLQADYTEEASVAERGYTLSADGRMVEVFPNKKNSKPQSFNPPPKTQVPSNSGSDSPHSVGPQTNGGSNYGISPAPIQGPSRNFWVLPATYRINGQFRYSIYQTDGGKWFFYDGVNTNEMSSVDEFLKKFENWYNSSNLAQENWHLTVDTAWALVTKELMRGKEGKVAFNSPRADMEFKSNDLLAEHFAKHGAQVSKLLGKTGDYSVNDFLVDAQSVIANGEYVPEINAYVEYYGWDGKYTEYLVVGLTQDGKNITTLYVSSINKLAKKAPGYFHYGGKK